MGDRAWQVVREKQAVLGVPKYPSSAGEDEGENEMGDMRASFRSRNAVGQEDRGAGTEEGQPRGALEMEG